MKTIVLVSCVSRKRNQVTKAKDLYFGPLFESSMAYAHTLGADAIYIISALHGLVELDDEIGPYDVTLTYVQPAKRKPGLKILDSQEKAEWGERVCSQLAERADLVSDKFILLASVAYAKPLRGRSQTSRSRS